jgi:hypothetical protein
MKCPHCGKGVVLSLHKLKLDRDGNVKVPLTRKEIGERFRERRRAYRKVLK